MQTSSKLILAEDQGKKNVPLPNQRVSRKVKNTKTWQQDSVDFFINNRKNSYGNRKSRSDIDANWNFYNNFLSPDDLKKTLDPLNVEKTVLKDEEQDFKFYGILDQPFDTLFGEELKRHSEVKAYAINPSIVNEKDNEFKEEVKRFLQQLVENEQQTDEKELQAKLKEYDKFRKNDLQSAHEKMVNNIIQTLVNDSSLNTKLKFNQGFKNLEIIAEEIYRVGHAGKELTLDVVNSADFYVLGLGYSPYISDGYAWIEEDKVNPHKIIEEFAEELTDSEIEDIISKSLLDKDSMMPHRIGLVDVSDPDSPYTEKALPIAPDNQFISIDGADNAEIDADGNIRIYRVQWKSLRKIGKLKYYDEQGDVQYDWVDEYYTPQIDQGEEVEWLWVNEIWEGTRIGNTIYKRIRPCPVQMRSQVNPALVKPSYVGYVLSNNGIAQKSRIDRLRPYQEMYNIWANKLVKLWTEHIGKAAVIDVARIPSEMSSEEWYLWLKRFNLVFENSMEEGKKGAAKGQIVGNMQQNSKVLDLGLAEEINQAIVTLSWIEERVNKISAVPEARQGATSGREGLGVTQQSIVSSSNQTEVDFAIHDLVKSKVYEVMIEYIKVLWKDEKGKRQFMLDDLSNYILDVDGELLNESEYGVKITNSSQLYSMYNAIQQLTHAAMQTGTATLSDVARMYMATSPSQMLHELEEAEEKRIEQQNEQARMQQEGVKAQIEAQQQLEQIKHQQELEKINLEWSYKLKEQELENVARLNEHATDTNQNHIEDSVELEKEQIKADSDKELQDKKLSHEEKLKRMELQSKEKIERMKANNNKK